MYVESRVAGAEVELGCLVDVADSVDNSAVRAQEHAIFLFLDEDLDFALFEAEDYLSEHKDHLEH